MTKKNNSRLSLKMKNLIQDYADKCVVLDRLLEKGSEDARAIAKLDRRKAWHDLEQHITKLQHKLKLANQTIKSRQGRTPL